jgi:hypothetical protein
VSHFHARDWAGFERMVAPTFQLDDRRRLVRLQAGAADFLAGHRVLFDLPDGRWKLELIATRGERLSLHRLSFAASGADGGGRLAYDEHLSIAEVSADGRFLAFVIFDLDDLDAAYAELDARYDAGDARHHPKAAPQRFANAASASADAVSACMLAHDWRGFAACFSDDFRMSDRRRQVQLELDRDRYVAFSREMAEGRTGRVHSDLLATRGDRLALRRPVYEVMGGDVGLSEVAFLILSEVDARGRVVANVRWDADDLDAAYAELDARWTAGEAAAHPLAAKWLADYLRCFAARDWPAMTGLFAPDLLGENHRLVGWGTRHGPEGVVSTLRAQIELAPDTQERVDHVRTGERAVLFEYAWHGTHEGGAFENVWVVLVELGADGRGRRADVWEVEQFAEARARFDALCTSRRPDPLAAIAKANAATEAMDRWRVFDGGAAADWDSVRASCAPGMIFEDRQGFARLSGDRELMIASLRERAASGARAERRLIGTAGERVVVIRMLWTGGPGDRRFEIEYLSVCEVDTAGLVTAIVLFGADDARGAQREAWARWAAIDPSVAATVALVGEANDAFNAKDRARLRERVADDVAVDDHRRTGMGRIDGGDAYVDSLAVLWDLAAWTRGELGWFWPACDRHGALYTSRRTGDVAGGGAFESDYLMLIRHAQGRLTRVELFELDQLDAALARFAERAATTRR